MIDLRFQLECLLRNQNIHSMLIQLLKSQNKNKLSDKCIRDIHDGKLYEKCLSTYENILSYNANTDVAPLGNKSKRNICQLF